MREARDLVERPRPVRKARVVAEVDEVLVRHRHQALVEDGEPADAGVEHADRPRVHRGDLLTARAGWRHRSGSAPARWPTTRSSSTGTRRACPRRSGSPGTPSTSRRSRSTRPSTACPTRRWCRAGPTGRRAGFVMHVKAFGLMTRHPVRLEQLPPDLREGMPLDERGRVDRPPRELRARRLPRVPRRARAAPAAGKLGGILFQLPPYVVPKPSSFDYLEWARDQLGGDEMLVEFRHRDWFAEERRAEVLRWLEERRMSYVTVDAPRLDGGNVPETVVAVTGPIAYVRFHGRNAATWNNRGGGAAQRFDYLYGRRSSRSGSSRCASSPGGPSRPTRSSTTTTRRTASPRPRPAPSSSASCSRSTTCPSPELRNRMGDGDRSARAVGLERGGSRRPPGRPLAAESLVPLGQLRPRDRRRRRRRCGPMGRGLRHCLPVGDMASPSA